MPLNNDFYGIYKIMKVKTIGPNEITGSLKPYVIEKFNVKTSMESEAKFYMQGSPLTRVLNIGNISETYNVTAPLLVPPINATYALQDGLQLLNDILKLQYGTNTLATNTRSEEHTSELQSH